MTATPRLLLVLAVLVGIFGALGATQATGGVAAICFGCLLAICARVIQARDYQREWRESLKRQTSGV